MVAERGTRGTRLTFGVTELVSFLCSRFSHLLVYNLDVIFLLRLHVFRETRNDEAIGVFVGQRRSSGGERKRRTDFGRGQKGTRREVAEEGKSRTMETRRNAVEWTYRVFPKKVSLGIFRIFLVFKEEKKLLKKAGTKGYL